MGYEIAGGLGVKMAQPDREVVVMVGDGSYLMMNSEIATSVMLGTKLVVVVLDNRGYGCINRLQQACGGAPFNNLFDDCVQGRSARRRSTSPRTRARWARSPRTSTTIAELEAALERARAADRTTVIVHRHRSARTDRRRRLVVGSGGARSLEREPKCAARARATSRRTRSSATKP